MYSHVYKKGPSRAQDSLQMVPDTALASLDSFPNDEIKEPAEGEEGMYNYLYPLKGFYALSGTFGELRSNHFHSGMDIKTGGQQGRSTYAIEDGYVYRIKVSPFGFGNAVYLQHPDGRFSVYAHLKEFNDEIKAYARKRQYTSQQFSQELYLNNTEIKVEKGDVIGYSGNSGSSGGPHLHFEIRTPSERILNPLQYYKNLIPDNIRPIVQELAFEPLEPSARIKGEYRKVRVSPTGKSGRYSIPNTIDIEGEVGLEYRAYDLLNGAGNHCGINKARLYLDNNLIYEIDLEVFSFDEKRYLNVHIDYDLYQSSRRRFEKAYVDEGNFFNSYKNLVNDGKIRLYDDQVHPFRLELEDLHGNISTVSGKLRNVKPEKRFPDFPVYSSVPQIKSYFKRNNLVIRVDRPHSSYMDGVTMVNNDGTPSTLKPAYMKGNRLMFVHPLNSNNYPKRITGNIGKMRLSFDFVKEVSPNISTSVTKDELSLYFPSQSTHHPVHLQVKKESGTSRTYTSIYRVGDPLIPLFKHFTISFPAPKGVKTSQLVIARKNGSGWEYVGGKVESNGRISAKTREFGAFALMSDTQKPSIRASNFSSGKTISKSQKTLSLKVNDSFSGIASNTIYGTLDGSWILFEYDAKYDKISYRLEQRPSPGDHQLFVKVKDEAGNETSKTYTLKF